MIYLKAFNILIRILPWTIILGGVIYFFAFKPTNFAELTQPLSTEDTHQIVVEKVESLGKLELVKYQVKDVVEHTQKFRFIPDTRIILIASGEAVGCIDLSKILEEDVFVKGDSLMLNLPAPELCYYKIDHQNSKVYDTKFTLLSRTDTLVAAAFRKAERQIKEAAIASGILEQTKTNARLMLKPMLETMTHKRVFLGFDMEKERLDFEKFR